VIAFIVGTTLGAILGWPGSPRLLQVLVPPLMILSAIPFYLFGLALIWIFAVSLLALPR
jgi:peptide/nickel transport system permease protein